MADNAMDGCRKCLYDCFSYCCPSECRKCLYDCFCCCCSHSEERQHLQPGKHDRPQETDPPSAGPIQDQPQPTPSEFTGGTSNSMEFKMKRMQSLMRRFSELKGLKVGIFSRSSEIEYQWLKKRLESESSRIVRPCLITNSGYQQFSDNLSWCDFAILYHSKNRGRINITNVNDSLYDEELQQLSEKLGKKNVIVVIDDLTDSSEARKNRILESQPSLKTLAQEIFLFCTDEKK